MDGTLGFLAIVEEATQVNLVLITPYVHCIFSSMSVLTAHFILSDSGRR